MSEYEGKYDDKSTQDSGGRVEPLVSRGMRYMLNEIEIFDNGTQKSIVTAGGFNTSHMKEIIMELESLIASLRRYDG